MSFPRFHPIVQEWFTTTLGQPAPVQLRGWEAIRDGRHTLIAAPTGSGKTLAAFLSALDGLTREGLERPLPDEVRVVYVSPLKALSADIHRNLAEPRRGIRRIAEDRGFEPPRITAAVRTGDTTASERAAMLRTPPHILVTTPESLYLLLTAERSRQMLRTVRTVIIDEIHAVIGTRRGAHLALSLERLQAAAEQPLQRIGLSATQKPIEVVARYLTGLNGHTIAAGCPECAAIDEGHRREMDLAVEIPRSPLDAVMSHEVWGEYYDRLTELIAAHQTTLVFVNTRRMAERLARHLSDRLGEDLIAAHHGSLSKETRLDAETRLKNGQLRALIATASLELGIDIGHVDLVCQIGSPHRIATLLQRVGRSGHTITGVPRGRIFPSSRDDLIECAALLRAVRAGELDAIVEQDRPLDVLAQQIVAETASRGDTAVSEDELYALATRAWPYRDLTRADFDAVVRMASEGFSTRRGRRAALLHRDEVNGTVRGRRGTRLLAQTSGGAIPEVADYRVILEPEETFIGTLNEDFAIESMAGDVFQLGNASWRVLQVAAGTVRVADAKGTPPNIPFWFGEAPPRSDELSRAVSDLRAALERRLAPVFETSDEAARAAAFGEVSAWLSAETGLCRDGALQAVDYVADGLRVVGAVPTQDTLVLERFFDEAGGMQLVLHAPFGSRINKAWGLALRKRFCRQFNFELQAAATEDALLLSLGPQHSFPLADVFRYLHPATTKDILVQAFLDAPVFQTRWRWNTTISLAVPRSRGGRKVAPQVQRMIAEDLLAAAFPDAAACLENIPGDRQIPDHPLVKQTVHDCLTEAMDIDGLLAVLERIHAGRIRLVARDTPEPSVFSHEILNARPYAFLDDAPLEERRAHAVQTRRAGEPSAAGDLGALDPAAIDRVRDEARPDPRDADEAHDALVTAGFLFEGEVPAPGLLQGLAAARRASRFSIGTDAAATPAGARWIAAERLPELMAVHPGVRLETPIAPPPSRAGRAWGRAEALTEIVRGRLTVLGPATAADLAASLGVEERAVDDALLALEGEGVILRGHFTAPAPGAAHAETAREAETAESEGDRQPGAAGPAAIGGTSEESAGRVRAALSSDAPLIVAAPEARPVAPLRSSHPGDLCVSRQPGAAAARPLEWCDRTLLARIHRYTLNRLRAEIEPVSAADYMRFLFSWQHVEPSAKLTGVDGLREAIAALDGFELGAAAWERAVLPARLDRYDPAMLDMLCLAGEVGWARLSAPRAASEPPRLAPATPIALFLREHADAWRALRARAVEDTAPSDAWSPEHLTEDARRVLSLLQSRGASFFDDIRAASGLDRDAARQAIGALVAAGLAASDGFSGLRALVWAAQGRHESADRRAKFAGRWTAVERTACTAEEAVEIQAWTLLRRYGVVFRRVLARETLAAPWRELVRVYRRLEARGEVRGGRFVSGMSGEQFALPAAIPLMREIRRRPADGQLVTISTADPLNLVGIVTSGDRVRAAGRNRLVYRDGVAIALREGDAVRELTPLDSATAAEVRTLLTRRPGGAPSPVPVHARA